ncbi:MAG: oligosaccharide flippase family protein, partial [Phaeodactylibacter sp.]|nr:oligosaccharide flippase family protein [Phaeodactylibacter sp.]
MKRERRFWVKAGSYSILGYLAQLGLAFVSFLALIRMMPEYEFGVWVLFLTITSFAEMARVGLTQNAVVKFCVEQREAYGEVLTAGFFLNTASSLLLSLLLLLAGIPLGYLWSAPELMGLLWWYPAFALLHGAARFIDNVQMAHGDFKGIFWSKLAFGLVFLASIFLLRAWKGEVPLRALPALQVLASLPSLGVALLYRTDYLKPGRLEWGWVRRLFHFGKYVLGTNFSSMFFSKLDIMMVGAFLHPMAVAVYNVAARITNYMEIPMSGVAQVAYPRLAAANKEWGKGQVAHLYERMVGLLLAMLLPMAVLVLGLARPIVVFLAGEAYADAAPLLNILVVAVLAKPWGRLFGITLDAIGRPRLNFVMLLLALALNGALNLAFIPLWGVTGAALASLASMWCLLLASQLVLRRIIPIRQWNIFNRMWALYRRPMVEL